MEVSKLTLSKGLRDQTLATDVLLWMRDHFDKCKNTNCKKLAVAMGLDKDFKPHATTGSIDQTIHKLMRRGLVIRQGTNLWHSNFLVNHGHPDMPPIVDEGFIKVTSTKDDSPTAVFRRNGSKTLAQLIFEWMDAHPMYLVDTTAGEIATAIIKEGAFEGSYASIVSIIHRLMRDGRIKKFNKTDGYRSLADFKLVKKVEPEEEASPDYEYETLKTNKTPEEEQEVMENNIKSFKELVNDGMAPIQASILTEPKESSTTQAIKLADGSTVNLTININIGK